MLSFGLEVKQLKIKRLIEHSPIRVGTGIRVRSTEVRSQKNTCSLLDVSKTKTIPLFSLDVSLYLYHQLHSRES